MCKSCLRPVRWVLTDAGKRMPLDPEPFEGGNVWVDHYEGGMPIVRVASSRAAVPAAEALVYLSHFVTCPNADKWRKK